MGIRKVQATEAQCDGCSKVTLGTDDEPAYGLYINWTEVDGTGGNGGKLFACNERCAAKALKRRHEIEEENRRG